VLEVNKIYLGDCLDYLKGFPDKSIDCVITDPPYGHEINHYDRPQKRYSGQAADNTDYGDLSWNKIPDKEVFTELFRISKNQIIFGANYFHNYLPQSNGWIVWDKRGEFMKSNFADGELIWTSFDFALRIKRYIWNGMIQENMKNKEKRIHPCQKPIELMRQLIGEYTSENDLIFDPFMGGQYHYCLC